MNQEVHLPETGYVRLPTILAVLSISKTTWWLGIKKGNFPRAVHPFGLRIACWHAEDIHQLIKRGA